MKTAVIGAGLIGQAWSIVFARGGLEVTLWDGDPEALARAGEMIAALTEKLQDAGLVPSSQDALARIRRVATLEEALADADYVQECLPESVEVKKEIFARMDVAAKHDAVLASSTSSIAASRFTEHLPGRARCLVAHPVNPPYLVPVVELCGAPWTDPAVVAKAHDLLTRVRQTPIVVKKEIKGFILNRLQGALLREAFRLVQNDCVTVEDLDLTLKNGLGLRWSFMGPFETIDLNAPDGLRDYCERYGTIYNELALEQADTTPWPQALIEALDAERRKILPREQLKDRRVWRDEHLMALLRHKAGER
ncbi:3-hydroxyacyl-CoA dehydrogenase [Castellaniella sp.]|uniref:3-hydroxyacyl-CoA dehydrogenase n=1 Tax=Castellaniella sp. TaxID=1955812 RepID=UPI0035645A60